MTVTTAQLDIRLTALEQKFSNLALTLTAEQLASIAAAFPKAITVSVSGVGTTPPGTGTTTPPDNQPPVTDVNTYPFTLSAGRKAGDTITLGTGPNQIDLYLASNPGGGIPNDVVILINNKAVLAPDFKVLSMSGLDKAGSDHLVLKGPWGDKPTVQIKGVAPNGINGLWMNGATIDYVDLVANGVWDSRGGQSINSTQVFISNGTDLTLGAPIAVAPPPPVVQPTLIDGKTLAQIVGAGGTISLPGQSIIGTSTVPAGTKLSGAGTGKTIIDGSGIAPTQSKGLLVPTGPSTITDLTVKSAYIGSGLGLNAAGIRNADSTVPLDVQRVELVGNQNGVLTDSASVGPFNFDGCNIHGNGEATQPGNTHNLYVGGLPSAVLTISNSTVSSCRDGHEVKSRCGTTIAKNNIITTGGNGACFDIPNGGILQVSDCTLTLPAGAAARNMIAFAFENTNNAATGNTVTVTNTVFVDLTGQGGFIESHDPTATINLTGCTYKGSVAPIIRGWGKVNGVLTKAG